MTTAKNTPSPDTCPRCRDEKMVTCRKCSGSGKVSARYYDLTTGHDVEKEETCMLCGGTGRMDCPECSVGA